MVIVVTTYCKVFSHYSLPPRQFLSEKITLEKKKIGEVLIEQIIGLDNKKPGAP